jgi:hypothetical protein
LIDFERRQHVAGQTAPVPHRSYALIGMVSARWNITFRRELPIRVDISASGFTFHLINRDLQRVDDAVPQTAQRRLLLVQQLTPQLRVG